MKSTSGRVLTKALERNGWLLLRVHGSHHIYGKDSSPIRLSVPVHGDRHSRRACCDTFLVSRHSPKTTSE